MNSTDKIRDVKSIGETACGTMRGVINAVRRCVSTGSGKQIVVVAIVDQRVPKHEERPSICLYSNKRNSYCENKTS